MIIYLKILREPLSSNWQYWINLHALTTASLLCFPFHRSGFLGIWKFILGIPARKKSLKNAVISQSAVPIFTWMYQVIGIGTSEYSTETKPWTSIHSPSLVTHFNILLPCSVLSGYATNMSSEKDRSTEQLWEANSLYG